MSLATNLKSVVDGDGEDDKDEESGDESHDGPGDAAALLVVRVDDVPGVLVVVDDLAVGELGGRPLGALGHLVGVDTAAGGRGKPLLGLVEF